MKSKKPWFPIVICFIIFNTLFFVERNWLERKSIDQDVLIVGNLILFIATLLSFIVYTRSMNNTNQAAAVRGMYGSFIIKFFICLTAAFIYIIIARSNVNKPALLINMGLYIVYTIIEVSTLQKLLKQKKNA